MPTERHTATNARTPDSIVNNCIVAKSKSGWAWLCRECGRGGVTGRARSWRELAVLSAKNHVCEVECG